MKETDASAPPSGQTPIQPLFRENSRFLREITGIILFRNKHELKTLPVGMRLVSFEMKNTSAGVKMCLLKQ